MTRIFTWLSLLFCIVIIGSLLIAQPKFIVAGLWDSTDYYHDILPDSTFAWWAGTPAHYYLDADSNSINDFKFTSTRSWAAFWGEELVYLQALNGEFNSLNNWYVRIFNLNDTIRNDSLWVGNGWRRINYHTWQQCPPLCPGYNTYVNNNLVDKYLGIRLITPNDTLYGWVMLSTSGGYQITLKEWAINTSATNSWVRNPVFPGNTRIYPNPTNDQFLLSTEISLNEAAILIYNSRGHLVKCIDKVSGHSVTITCANLPAGLYYIQISQALDVIAVAKLLII